MDHIESSLQALIDIAKLDVELVQKENDKAKKACDATAKRA